MRGQLRGLVHSLLVTVATASLAPRPHIVLVAIDDWGWNNWGLHARSQANAAEIVTPRLDALAAEGLVLERHYVFRFCSPSRSALHTGRNPIHVNVLNSPLAVANVSDPVSGFAGIPRNMTALPAKLAAAGYATVQAGKWHLGLATPDHTPRGRGYVQSLSYLDGANDYWNSVTGDWCGDGLWTDLWASAGPAFGHNNSWACSDARQGPQCRYEDDIFTAFAVDAISRHDAAAPLMLYFAPHAVHLPLEVPAPQLAKFAFINGSEPRRRYAAMTNLVDAHVGAVVDALVARGLWKDTLLLVTADNGGPIFGQSSTCKLCDGSAGANNWPLRGGKHSGWEGGIRANAFVSGGFLPTAMRGKATAGLVGIEDWYVTLCGLAGADPTDARAAAAGLPPVEGVDVWPLLSGANATSPRTEVVIGSHVGADGAGAGPTFVQGIITADGWKLLHSNMEMNVFTGPFYPNASTPTGGGWPNTPLDCGPPTAPTCLFNVFDDPTEHDNVAAARPDVVAALAARIAALQAGVFSPARGTPSPLACNASNEVWGGFVGPFLP